ncbi:MAG: radical SAM protein [Oscillospiraceae bacterium]|nr:radical SAM protein [Oscillospiraceae bacterium]
MKQKYFISKFIGDKSSRNVLYVHTPFCPSKCLYCDCSSYVPAEAAEISLHLMEIQNQIIGYQGIFDEVSFQQVYFGGGTPSILNVEQLESLFSYIPKFISIPLKCIEVSPTTVTDEHLELLQKYRFSFISMGVQSINRSECAKWNRPYVSRSELQNIAGHLIKSEIYFNIDLICFLDKGDIRDLYEFEKNLRFILAECNPSSVTIHQLYQSHFTMERTYSLIQVLRDVLNCHSDYTCVNSLLEDGDQYFDTLHQAEYRLATRDLEFTHYMWNKFASMPIKGYNILSLGYSNRFQTVSNAGNLLYHPGKDAIKLFKYDDFIDNEYCRIRKQKSLPI